MRVLASTVGPRRALILSVAAHGAFFAVLGAAVVGGPSPPAPPGPFEARWEAPPALEPDPPALEESAPEVSGAVAATSPVELVETAIPESGDPRFEEDARDAGAPAGAIGVALARTEFPRGPSRGTGLGRRGRSAAPAAPAPEPAPDRAPAGPTVAARRLADACPTPAYPAREHRLGIEGVVEVRAEVDAAGAVASAVVDASSGCEALDRAAVDAVLGWRFEPALLAGAPVPDTVLVRVRFRLVAQSASGREP
jgi:TonB family protein